MTAKRVRSFTIDKSLCAAEKLWRAFCQAARISTGPSFGLRAWTERGADWFNRRLPDVEGEPPVEIETTDRSRQHCLDVMRFVRIRGPRKPLEFSAMFARQGEYRDIFATDEVVSPDWTLVSATVDFGPDGSLDRAWAVLELFAGWEPEVASGWDLDEIADALAEVPNLRAEFVEKDSIISAFLDETPHVYGRNRLIQQPIIPRRESEYPVKVGRNALTQSEKATAMHNIAIAINQSSLDDGSDDL